MGLVLAALIDLAMWVKHAAPHTGPKIHCFVRSGVPFLSPQVVHLGRHKHSKICVSCSLQKPWRVECEHRCVSASHQSPVALCSVRCDVPEYALDQGVAALMFRVPEVQWTVVGAPEPLEHQLPQIPYSLLSLYFALRGLLYSFVLEGL